MNTDDPWTNDRLPREITVDPQSYGTTADLVLRIPESLKPALSKSTRHGSFSVDNRCTQRDKPERALARRSYRIGTRDVPQHRVICRALIMPTETTKLKVHSVSEIHLLIRRPYLASLCAPFTNKGYRLSYKTYKKQGYRSVS